MLPLFNRYPRLAANLSWLRLGEWPTPVVPAVRFGRGAGLSSLYVKREDLSHPVGGGNKVRGLEFLLGDVRRRGAGTIVTAGAAGSHHVSRTAYHAARHGVRVVAVLVRQPMAAYARRNVMAALRAGATLVPANRATAVPQMVARLLVPQNWSRGRAPYFAMPGGSTRFACIGHVNAAFELRDQVDRGELPEPEFIHVPLGSLGTAAGLLVGCKLAGLRSRIVGVVTSYGWYATGARVARMARRVLATMRAADDSVADVSIGAGDIDVVGGALGPGYACFTESSVRLARQFIDLEGIALDGTYTAKTLAGAVAFVTDQRLGRGVHLLWHTYQRLSDAPADAKPPDAPGWLAESLRAAAQPLDALIDAPAASVSAAGRRGSGGSHGP